MTRYRRIIGKTAAAVLAVVLVIGLIDSPGLTRSRGSSPIFVYLDLSVSPPVYLCGRERNGFSDAPCADATQLHAEDPSKVGSVWIYHFPWRNFPVIACTESGQSVRMDCISDRELDATESGAWRSAALEGVRAGFPHHSWLKDPRLDSAAIAKDGSTSQEVILSNPDPNGIAISALSAASLIALIWALWPRGASGRSAVAS